MNKLGRRKFLGISLSTIATLATIASGFTQAIERVVGWFRTVEPARTVVVYKYAGDIAAVATVDAAFAHEVNGVVSV
jgi:hypothetical protein